MRLRDVLGMNSFERQIEDETNERIEEACAIEREITARRCAKIAGKIAKAEFVKNVGYSAGLAIKAEIERAFGLNRGNSGRTKKVK